MGNIFYFPWEPELMIFLQKAMNPFLINVMSVFSMLGEEYFLVVIFALVYLCINKEVGEYVAFSVLSSMCWNCQIKNIFLRLRPYIADSRIVCYKPVDKTADIYDVSAQGYSFPSGHATNTSAIFGALAFGFRKKWLTVVAIVIPLLVSLSRVMLGNHYPTDVLAGLVMGALSMAIFGLLTRVFHHKKAAYIVLLLTAVPGIFFCKTTDYFTSLGITLGFILGSILEHRFVNFKNTKNVLRIILRMVGAFAIFIGLNTLLKLPFSKEFLESGTYLSFFVRTMRYFVTIFIIVFVYPMSFRIGDKIEKEKALKKAEHV